GELVDQTGRGVDEFLGQHRGEETPRPRLAIARGEWPPQIPILRTQCHFGPPRRRSRCAVQPALRAAEDAKRLLSIVVLPVAVAETIGDTRTAAAVPSRDSTAAIRRSDSPALQSVATHVGRRHRTSPNFRLVRARPPFCSPPGARPRGSREP